MSDVDAFFVTAVRDLHAWSSSTRESDCIQTARILRQMFLDLDKLVHLVNRDRRLPLRFSVVVREPPPDFGDEFAWLVLEGLLPDRSSREPSSLSLDAFLSTPIAGRGSQCITIHEVIKFATTSLGAVHIDANRDRWERKFVGLIGAFEAKPEAIIASALRVISTIALSALVPLRDQVLRRGEFVNQTGVTTFLRVSFGGGILDENTFIFDIGKEVLRERLSLYVNGSRRLTLRYIDSLGNRRYVHAGTVGYSIPVHTFMNVFCTCSSHGGRWMLSLSVGGDDCIEVGDCGDIPGLDVGELTIGRDPQHESHSDFSLQAFAVYGRVLVSSECSDIVNYYDEEFRGGGPTLVFQGDKFLRSDLKHSAST